MTNDNDTRHTTMLNDTEKTVKVPVEAKKFQDRLFYGRYGQRIKESIKKYCGEEATQEQVVFIWALRHAFDKKDKTIGDYYHEIPATYLCLTMIRAKTEEEKKWAVSRAGTKYMSYITKTCIEPLVSWNVLKVRGAYEKKCRQFSLNREWVMEYLESVARELSEPQDLTLLRSQVAEHNPKILKEHLKQHGLSEDFKYLRRLPANMATMIRTLQSSKFIFDAEFYWSAEGKAWLQKKIKEERLKLPQQEAIVIPLRGLNKYTNDSQYHDVWHMQTTGRVNTSGGCLFLPPWFRHKFIKPVNRRNKVYEFDLKCAQLIILCEILKQDKLLDQLLAIIEREGSIWDSIRRRIPKPAAKVIVYGFCYSADEENLPWFANKELRRKGIYHIVVNNQMVEEMFSGILSPLIEARDDWMRRYDGKPTVNALGLKYKGSEYGSALAHLAQGKEQEIIQSLIAAHSATWNVLTYQYDGCTIESPAPIELDSWLNYPLEVERVVSHF